MAASDNYTSGQTFTRITILFVSTATTIVFAVRDVVASTVLYVRDRLQRLLDEPLLRLPIAPKLLPIALERVVEKVCPPVIGAEPAFVGGGAMFRRWR